eukprot:COSAG02_NODE_588_length_19902_cov_115.928900_4_plen_158_part_00
MPRSVAIVAAGRRAQGERTPDALVEVAAAALPRRKHTPPPDDGSPAAAAAAAAAAAVMMMMWLLWLLFVAADATPSAGMNLESIIPTGFVTRDDDDGQCVCVFFHRRSNNSQDAPRNSYRCRVDVSHYGTVLCVHCTIHRSIHSVQCDLSPEARKHL